MNQKAPVESHIQDTRDELGLTLDEFEEIAAEAGRVGEKLVKELEELMRFRLSACGL
jgi:hypothetical protein